MSKTIVIAFAGTGQDRHGPDRDNPTMLCDLLDSANIAPGKQVHHYVTGIGTDQKTAVGRLYEQAKAKTFPEKVREAYRFLAENYKPGDKIIITGFSRGSALGRSLAGMIRNVGIIKPELITDKLIEKAYKVYTADKHPDDDTAKEFRSANSLFVGVNISCLAVFDTVIAWDSDGYHDFGISKMVQTFRHAISLDERRGDFDWAPAATNLSMTDSEQRLFPGVHSDVGGSYQHRGLAQGAHLWMLEEMIKCGLQVPKHYMTQLRKLSQLAPKHVSDDTESNFSDVSSSDEEGIAEEIELQSNARPNPWDKAHKSHEGFPFKMRRKIVRGGFDSTCDFTVDSSVEARMADPDRHYKSKAISKTAITAMRSRRRTYDDARKRLKEGKRVPTSRAKTSVTKNLADRWLKGLAETRQPQKKTLASVVKDTAPDYAHKRTRLVN